MFSRRVLLLAEVAFKLASHMGACPILYNSKTNTIYSTKSSRFYAILITTVLLVQMSFTIFQISRFSQKDSNPMTLYNSNVSYILMLSGIIPLICSYLLNGNVDNLINCLNQVLHYTVYIRERWVPLSDTQLASSYPTTGILLEAFLGLVVLTASGYYFLGGIVMYYLDVLPVHWLYVVPMGYRSRALCWVHVCFYTYATLVSVVITAIAVGLTSGYLGKDAKFVPV